MRPARCLPAIAGPYQLTPQSAELLSAAAQEGCTLCRGTGVSTWKSHGRRPEVCRCARDAWRTNADEMAARLQKNNRRLLRADGSPL